ncbi:MAG: fluoride efflux transporter CrcB [Pseudomonadales bacterium]|nr:fluoride efflux transporter CrcB [Pseudomonadales bacterium]
MSNTLLLVMLGGALGAGSRYLVSVLSLQIVAGGIVQGPLFPWGTLGINIAGSFAIGLMWSLYADADWFQQWGRPLIVIGVLGGFTTFSTFSLDALHLFDTHKVAAFGYAVSSVVGCLVAVGLGHWLGLQSGS